MLATGQKLMDAGAATRFAPHAAAAPAPAMAPAPIPFTPPRPRPAPRPPSAPRPGTGWMARTAARRTTRVMPGGHGQRVL